MLTGLECDWDPASARQTGEYVIGLSELKRKEQRDEMAGVPWQRLFDESGRKHWGKVCLAGESALRPSETMPTLRISNVEIGVVLDAAGVAETAMRDKEPDEWVLMTSFLCDNCSTMSGEISGSNTRIAVMMIVVGMRETMLPRIACVLHVGGIGYTNGHKGLVGVAPPFKRGYAKTLQLDSYLKNLEYSGDKSYEATNLIYRGLGYVKLPEWDKHTQLVHNILPADRLWPGKTKQIQIASLPCEREKHRKAKTNRWIFNHEACVSAHKHDFADIMYNLQQTTKINYNDPDCPRIWISKYKQSMEARHVRWRCGPSIAVMMVQCHLQAEIELGGEIINPIHFRSIGRGSTYILPGPSYSIEKDDTTGRLIRIPRRMTFDRTPAGYRMPNIALDAEYWLMRVSAFKADPYSSPNSVFAGSYAFAQQVLFPRARDLKQTPVHDPLTDFERDLQNCANATQKSLHQWLSPFLLFPSLIGVLSSPEHGPALARAVLAEKYGMQKYVSHLGGFTHAPTFTFKVESPAYESEFFQPRRMKYVSQSELTAEYRRRVKQSISDEADRQRTAFVQKWATGGTKKSREQVADSKAERVRSNYLFDSFGFLECVWSSPLAKTDLMIFAQANTPHGIQFKISPYITDYPRLLKLFNSIVSSQLIHQQKIENDFGKIDNISQRNSKMRMRALVLWRENCERKHLFNAQSVQELGARGYKRHFKVKRVDCEFSNIEYKSKVCKTECLVAAANARARAKQQETAAH
jgi:hypothetical protein